jgi:flagellar hook-length control protein FliK
MLLNHSGELKAALMEQGIRLDKVDVQSTFNFEHYTAHHQQQQSNAFGGRRRNGRSVHLSRQAEEGGPDVDDILSDRHQRETGGLNIVA